MKKPLSLYFLYCVNMHCQVSVFNHLEEVQVAFTAENLIKDHTCPRCNNILSSAIDLNIKKLLIEVNKINTKISLSTK